MNKHWAVLIFSRHLGRTDARFHEYFAPGVTACNRTWFVAGFGMRHTAISQPAEWVHRKNAERFAEPCKKCAAVLSATERAEASDH